MKYIPQHKALRKHIDHYWIIENVSSIFNSFKGIYAYPGIRPELIMPLKGNLTFHYLGKTQVTQKSMMFSHIEGNFLFYPNQLQLFVILIPVLKKTLEENQNIQMILDHENELLLSGYLLAFFFPELEFHYKCGLMEVNLQLLLLSHLLQCLLIHFPQF
ncbi:MAG: hypothetical protein ACPGVB_10515 [Chitinophagales bacterium]